MKDNLSAFNSKEYDQKIKITLPYYEEFYKQVIDLVKITGNCQIQWLDIGCGTGKMAETALKEIDIKEFVFSDRSAEMIALVRERFDYANVKVTVSDILNLKYQNQFDVITAIQVNHYLHKEERKQAVMNCYQALHEGGMFFTFENFAPFGEEGKSLYLKRWKSYQMSQGKTEEEAEAHISRYGKGYFPITLTDHLDVMHECGFRTVEVLWLSYMQVGLIGIK